MVDEILYTHVKRRSKAFEPGHWFFHTGGWVVCASAGHADGRWQLHLMSHVWSRPLPEAEALSFDSMSALQKFLASYFGVPVRAALMREWPKPDDL